MELEELQVYQISMDLGEKIWQTVYQWEYFAKDTIGKQLVRASDSISANIAEGFGRYHFKDSKNFYYYARGSIFEVKNWLTKARNRKLIGENDFSSFSKELNILGKKLNSFINSIKEK